MIRRCRVLPPSWTAGAALTAKLFNWSAAQAADEAKKLNVNH
jgi:hypothetical protein